MILDLTVFKRETLDITMMDGQKVHVKKPSQNMVIEIIKFRDINKSTPPEKLVAAVDDFVTMLLNDNTDGITFERDNIATIDMDIKLKIIEAYTAFMVKVQSDPT